MHCVFNVKKRSWKNGIQVDVQLAGLDLDRAKALLEFEPWAQGAVASAPPDEREAYRQRAGDLLAQKLCAVKLELALEAGVPQVNHVLGRDQLVVEFEAALPGQVTAIKEWIVAELDIGSS